MVEKVSRPVRDMLEDLKGTHPWIPGVVFRNDPELATRLSQVIRENQVFLSGGPKDE